MTLCVLVIGLRVLYSAYIELSGGI